MTVVVSLIVAVSVEQRELSGNEQRAKSRPGQTIGAPSARTTAMAALNWLKTVDDHSIPLSTNTFSEGT